MKKVVDKVITKDELVAEFKELGLKPKMVVEVHSSLSAFGYVVGGAQTVVDALIETVGYEGTIVMSMQTADNTEPANWENPPIEYEAMQKVRESFPAFNKKESDTRGMGAVVRNFRRRDGVSFTNHPTLPFVVWGKYAKLLCNHQSLNFPLSEESATARLYELKAYCLLLGVDFDTATSLHLAEYRANARPIKIEGAAIKNFNERKWIKYLNIDLNSDEFPKGMRKFEKSNYLATRQINGANCKLYRIDQAVDYLVKYYEQKLSKYINL